MRKDKTLLPYLLLLPALVPVALIIYYPLSETILASLYHSVGLKLGKESTFVGLSNYRMIIGDKDFLEGTWLMFTYAMGSVFGAYILGLMTALVLNVKFKGRTLVRTLIIFPWAVPTVVVVIVWLWMFNTDFGVLNYLLSRLHFIKHNLRWLSNPSLAMLAVILTTVWKGYPIATLMLLAGLQTVPRKLYEAADIDGANKVQKFLFITFPALSAVNSILLILLLIWGMGKLVFILLMTQGGPAGSTETLPMKIYLQAFRYFHLGEAAVIGVLVLCVSLILSFLYMGFTYKARR